MSVWYEELPERLESELAALTEANIAFKIDEDARAHDLLRLHLQIAEESYITIPPQFNPLNLTVVFPERYPYVRPEVYAPETNLPRHQNLVSKNLCLIPRSTSYWLPENTLVHHLRQQLWKVLTEGEITDPDILNNTTHEQAEPASEYYPSWLNATVIFDPTPYECMIVEKEKPIEWLGIVNLGLSPTPVLPSPMLVTKAYNTQRETIGELPEKANEIFPSELVGSIYRLSKRPPNADPERDLNWVVKLLNQANDKLYTRRQPLKLSDGSVAEDVVGISFPEEIRPGEFGWGWLFIVSFNYTQIVRNGKVIRPRGKFFYYAKISRINSEELSFRIPQLKPLSNKKIAIVGLGALGAPSAIEFARNNVGELAILDHDIVDAGTTVRWPLGLNSAGLYKTDALKNFVNENYPFTDVKILTHKLGSLEINATSLPPENFESEHSRLEKFFADAALIFDATAEVGISHFLSDEARKRKIPFVSIYATPGIWGGTVMRVIPGQTKGCWMCLRYALEDGSIPKPPADPNGDIQALGCGDVSFIGTSYELQNIISTGVRLAISSLCSNQTGNMDIKTDVGVLSLVNDEKKQIFPKWSEHTLEIHPNCPYCGNKDIQNL